MENMRQGFATAALRLCNDHSLWLKHEVKVGIFSELSNLHAYMSHYFWMPSTFSQTLNPHIRAPAACDEATTQERRWCPEQGGNN